MSKIETRGRKIIYNEPLTEAITLVITKTQKEELDKVLKRNNIKVSSYIRMLLFEDQ